MEYINFTVTQQKIECDRKILVSKTQGEYKCKFTFDETWNGLTKSAVFLKGDSKVKILLDSKGECKFADELLTERGNLYIGVFGASATIIKPTIKTDLMVILEGVMGGTDPVDPTPSEYQQIISNYNTAIANFNNEVSRATAKETELNSKIVAETTRAITKETSIESKVDAEETRAKAKENEIASSVSAEETRAKAKENEIVASIPTKVSELTNDTGFVTNAYHDNSKQDVINDLSSIRSGAALGSTALQSVPDTYAKKTDLPTKTSQLTNDSGFLTQHQDISGKQDKLTAGENITIVNNVISAANCSVTKEYVDEQDANLQDQIDDLSDEKQDKINDLETIRSGAQAGATAVQPSGLNSYYSKAEVDALLKDVLILNVKGDN